MSSENTLMKLIAETPIFPKTFSGAMVLSIAISFSLIVINFLFPLVTQLAEPETASFNITANVSGEQTDFLRCNPKNEIIVIGKSIDCDLAEERSFYFSGSQIRLEWVSNRGERQNRSIVIQEGKKLSTQAPWESGYYGVHLRNSSSKLGMENSQTIHVYQPTQLESTAFRLLGLTFNILILGSIWINCLSLITTLNEKWYKDYKEEQLDIYSYI
jgi:hypothetical protein